MKRDKLIAKIVELEAVKKECQAREQLKDLLSFNREILQVEDGPKAVSLVPFHREMCDFVTSPTTNKKLILVPRGHLKSTLITVGYSLLRIAQNPEVRILIANATYDMACSFLGQIKKHLQSNEKFRDYYGDLATNADRWSENMISVPQHKPFTKKEATVTAYGIGGNLVSQHYDLIIMDDIVNRDYINTTEQIEKTILFYKDALDLLEPEGKIIIVGCLVKGTKVLMADGALKSIEKIKQGEKVISHNSVQIVEAVVPQGRAKVFELETRNHTIVATPNHPFLTKDGFKQLINLKKGEKIKVFRYYSSRKHRDKYGRDDMWILGFMLGDGWITENPNKKYNSLRLITCFAKGVDDKTNKKALKILSKKGTFKETRGGYYRTENIAVGRYLREMGFKGKAKTKRIPNYVYSLSAKLRESFLEGFLSADGYMNNGLRCLEISNKELTRDLKNLAEICGYKVSNIHSRTRLSQPPHSPKPILATSYHISIGNRKKEIKWDWEAVTSIKEKGGEEVYDLTVSNTHNFIAEGLVVHNTRWHDADLYGWIMDKTNPERIYENFDIMIRQAYQGNLETGENLSILFPTKFNQEILKTLKREKGPYEFYTQWMNDPIPQERAKFKIEWMKTVLEDELRVREINCFTMVDPAIGQRKDSDKTAIVTIGVDQFNNWFVLNIIWDHLLPNQIIEHIFWNWEEYHPRKIGIELTAYQKSLQYSLVDEMRSRNIFLPIVELKAERSKEERIEGLIPRYANGSIYHLQQCPFREQLEDELVRFPRGKHDDIIDALAYGLQIAHQSRSGKPKYRYYNNDEEKTMRYLY